jgi:hypothetical protein
MENGGGKEKQAWGTDTEIDKLLNEIEYKHQKQSHTGEYFIYESLALMIKGKN